MGVVVEVLKGRGVGSLSSLLVLLGSTELLVAVLAFLDLLTGVSVVLDEGMSGLTVLGLVLLDRLHVIINKAKAGRLATTKGRSEAKDKDHVLVGSRGRGSRSLGSWLGVLVRELVVHRRQPTTSCWCHRS